MRQRPTPENAPAGFSESLRGLQPPQYLGAASEASRNRLAKSFRSTVDSPTLPLRPLARERPLDQRRGRHRLATGSDQRTPARALNPTDTVVVVHWRFFLHLGVHGHLRGTSAALIRGCMCYGCYECYDFPPYGFCLSQILQGGNP